MQPTKLFSNKIIEFLSSLEIKNALPPGVEVLNPYAAHSPVMTVVDQFYQKYYHENKPRHLILGINPGRLGAGATGIPFTDTKRLNEVCGLPFSGFQTHEPSSVFVYRVIDAFGGPDFFYSQFFIGSVCPLGFATRGKNGLINMNYYDSQELTEAVLPFIIKSINQQLDFGLSRDNIFVLGAGKNFNFLKKLNRTEKFAETLVALEHPRFIMQYRARKVDEYVSKYLALLGSRAV